VPWVLLTLLCTMAVARPANATVSLEVPIAEMARRASHVVHGVVVARTAAWEDGHIYTSSTLSVLQTIKGQGERRIVVKQLGGVVGHLGMKLAGQATFEIGDEVVVFVKPGKTALEVIGMAQGRFQVQTDAATGQKLVGRDLTGLLIARRDAQGRLQMVAPNLLTHRPLDAFLDEIRDLVATGGGQ
jgi:hypothetical protein